MHQQRRHRCSDKGGEQNIRRGGPEEERTDRGERERTARQTGTWLWQERVRAEENQGRRSCRYAKHAGCGRFLATGVAATTHLTVNAGNLGSTVNVGPLDAVLGPLT